MKISDLHYKKIAVLGFGMEGQAVTQYLIKHGLKPVLFDQRPWNKFQKNDQKKIKSSRVNYILGKDAFKKLMGLDVAFKSPGIPFSHPDLEKQLKRSGGKKLEITSQTKFFFKNCPSKIIGVTGTKGKGTTATLIYEMLVRNSKIKQLKSKIYLTGNIGKKQPLDFLDNLKPEDFVVYELSSFQLENLDKSPNIAVVLMTTTEHLDYHKSQLEYLKAKQNICKFQNKNDFAIINDDFPNSRNIGAKSLGIKIYFSRSHEVKIGLFKKKDKIFSKNKQGKIAPYLNLSNIKLKGEHNIENVFASIIAAHTAGCEDAPIKNTIKNFKGLEHRLEFVLEKRNIKFYNDSFSTTPETAMAAIKAFTEPKILILGGSEKKSNFKKLGKSIIENNSVKALILIGQEASRIKKAISGYQGQIFENARTMEAIFKQIKSIALPGDVVLLSPACASFDMFKNYQDRGIKFKNEAKKFK